MKLKCIERHLRGIIVKTNAGGLLKFTPDVFLPCVLRLHAAYVRHMFLQAEEREHHTHQPDSPKARFYIFNK